MSDDTIPPAPQPPAPPAPQLPPEPQTFSREYVSELRGENKTWRLKAQAAEEAAAKAKADADAATAAAKAAEEKAQADAAAARTAAEQAANDRIIRAELKAAAIKAGMVDLDGLKLADLSAVKLDDTGNVTGADEMLAALKESKPYLFSAPQPHSSNPTPPPPAPKPGDKKLAKDMTPEEFQAARRAIAAGRMP
ncbi:phage scaffolding protein [Azospirillum sp. A1-3]|uniref:phage scaffolding protein n=1 Tax=Azospirillum sp. A1-3 TaxID=185874 RepID=UPI0020778EFC|nr:phage scaffolding protein [Azospirillum sp. A1-3]MCM8735999.1 phage scaffolding protein [Azospirillum sp. A1-3]